MTRIASGFERALLFLAACVCFLFSSSLRDTFGVRVVAAAPVIALVAAGEGVVTVHVVDSEGRELSDAVVRAFFLSAEGEVFFAAEGWTRPAEPVKLTGLPPGEIWIVAYGEGKARASTRVLLDPEERGRERTVTLALRDASILRARVVDDSGRPIAEATVTVNTSDPLPQVVTTDAEGMAVLDRLGPPPWEVSVEAEGYDSISRSGVYPDAAPLELKLERLGELVVTVVDETGSAVPEAEVLLSGPGIWPARSTIADENGEVVISGLYAGLYDLRAREGDRISSTDMNVSLGRGDVVERTLTLVPGRFVTVKVTDGPRRADGIDPRPIEAADVVVVEQGLSSFPFEGRTDSKGLTSVGPVGDGPLSISARAAGFVPRTLGVETLEGVVEVALLRGGLVFGEIRDGRNFPVDGATIEVFGTDADGMPIHESTDRSSFRDDLFAFSLGGPVPLIARGELGVMPGPIPPIPHASLGGDDVGAGPSLGDPWVSISDGTYRATPVTPGRIQVLIRHPDYIEWVSDVLTLTPGGELEVNAILQKGGRLEGRVLEEDRLAVVGARVEIAALEGTFSQVTYTSDDGSFAFASVPPEILVTVSRAESEGMVDARLDLSFTPNERKRIEIVLEKPREPVTLRFVDERGFPVSRVEARVLSLDLTTVLYRTHFTDDDGFVEVRGARGLPLRIVAERPGRAPLVETIGEAEREHRLVMGPALSVTGYVTAKGGRIQVAEASITLFTLAGAVHETTDEYGAFTFADLAPGRIRIVTRAAEFASDERILLLEGDGRRPIELETIDLSASGTVEGRVVDDAGDPIAGARVGHDAVPTYLPVGKLPYGIVQTNADGEFVLEGLPAGPVTLEAYSPDLGRGRSEELDIRDGRITRRVTITIPAQDYQPPKVRAAGSVALTLAERGGAVVIVDVPEGGEAELAGIEPGDRLLVIGTRNITSIEAARSGLSGPLTEDVIVDLSRELPNGGALPLKLRVRREVVRR